MSLRIGFKKDLDIFKITTIVIGVINDLLASCQGFQTTF